MPTGTGPLSATTIDSPGIRIGAGFRCSAAVVIAFASEHEDLRVPVDRGLTARRPKRKAPTFRPGLCALFNPDTRAQSDFLQKYQSTHSYSPLATRAFASSTLPGGGTMTFSPGCQFSGVAIL